MVLEGTEEVELPEVEGADVPLLVARMYGAKSSKKDSLRSFGAISLCGARVVRVCNCPWRGI